MDRVPNLFMALRKEVLPRPFPARHRGPPCKRVPSLATYMDTSNPFSAFAFKASSDKNGKRQNHHAGGMSASQYSIANISASTAAPNQAPIQRLDLCKASQARTSIPAQDVDPLCLWNGRDNFSGAEGGCVVSLAVPADRDAPDGSRGPNSTEMNCAEDETRMGEYELISAFRRERSATVDAFNAFLLSLHGETGRYWALVACLLSVQCLDTVALRAVKKLMSRAPGGALDVLSMAGRYGDDRPETVGECDGRKRKSWPSADINNAGAGENLLEHELRSLNYYKSKARFVVGCSEAVTHKWGGKVPEEYRDLISLPGVGPKIANLMRSVSFGRSDAGIVVDTHVHRIASLLGWTEPEGHVGQGTRKPRAGNPDHSRATKQPLGRRPKTQSFVATRGSPERTRVALEAWVPIDRREGFALDVIGFGQITRQQRASWARDFVAFARYQALGLKAGVGTEGSRTDASLNSESPPPRFVTIALGIIRKIEGGDTITDGDDDLPRFLKKSRPDNEDFQLRTEGVDASASEMRVPKRHLNLPAQQSEAKVPAPQAQPNNLGFAGRNRFAKLSLRKRSGIKEAPGLSLGEHNLPVKNKVFSECGVATVSGTEACESGRDLLETTQNKATAEEAAFFTGGYDRAAKTEAIAWICETCTFVNKDPVDLKCEVCAHKRN
mmetsp:Transcript_764/g.1661  ORF Transcript_764/g.1661 Transcript_764/m.1661 type:complete len:669 (+) Transcript_764:184-2190(+)